MSTHALSKVTTRGRVQAATRIVYGHYYMAPERDGTFTVFDDRNPDGRARLAEDLSFDEAVTFVHEAWLAEEFGQGPARRKEGTRG
jgi:glutamate synthase domain-containing protein 1